MGVSKIMIFKNWLIVALMVIGIAAIENDKVALSFITMLILGAMLFWESYREIGA